MTASGKLLPEGFEALEPYVETWAVDNAARRAELRGEAPEAERKAFYAVASDLVEPALSYLDARPLAEFDEGEKRLMNLMLSLAHVTLAEEVQRDAETHHAWLRSFMPVRRAASDD